MVELNAGPNRPGAVRSQNIVSLALKNLAQHPRASHGVSSMKEDAAQAFEYLIPLSYRTKVRILGIRWIPCKVTETLHTKGIGRTISLPFACHANLPHLIH